MRPRRRSPRSFVAILGGCAALALPPVAHGVVKAWVGTTGNWTTNANWSPFGRPINGDDVFLTSGDALHRTVTYNDTGAILHVYRSVRVDSTGAGLMTLQQLDPDTDLNAEFLYVGNAAHGTYDLFAGRGVFGAAEVHAQGVLSVRSGAQVVTGTLLQTGGTVNAIGSFTVTGSYTFNGGAASGHVTAGTFLSNGGAFGGGVTALNRLVLGGNGNGTFGGSVVNHGPFTLPAGRTLATSGNVGQVGASFTQLGNVSVGTESFLHSGATLTQQGGTHVARNLSIASNGPGTYAIGPGAQLTTTGLDIALGGDGTFTQTGGIVSVGGTFIRGPILLDPGRMYWDMSGGTMTHSGNFVVGHPDAPSGTFIQSAGFAQVKALHVNVNAATSASVNLSGGSFLAEMNSISHGAINITGGSLRFDEHLDGSGDVTVTGTGSLTAQRLRQFSLHIGGDGAVVLNPPQLIPNPTGPETHRVRSLTFEQVANTVKGKLDPGGRLIVDYSGASPAASIRQYLASGYAGGAWDGTGIHSDAAANSRAANVALGWAESSNVLGPSGGTFGDLDVDSTAILIRFTFYGDANLDGIVNLADFNRLAGGFGQSGRIWSQGDFTYDGVVNLLDFNRLASNFGVMAPGPDVTPNDWAQLASAIPEPTSTLTLLGVAASAALFPRPRTRSPR